MVPSLSPGNSESVAGSPLNLNGGASTGSTGGNMYLKGGTGTSSGSVFLVNPSTSSNYGVISYSTLDFSR